MTESINAWDLPKYKTILLKDARGERYTYHDARACAFDDEIHIYYEDYHVVFNKKDVTMFVLRNGEE